MSPLTLIKNKSKLKLIKMIGLQIQTTPFCNSKCVICPHAISWLNKSTGIMTDRVFNKILIENY